MKMQKPKSMPTPLTLIMLVIVIAAVSTWLLPAGQYSKLAAQDKTFVITSSSTTTKLPFTQHTLDSLSIKIPLQKFSGGDIRKPISVPGTYQKQEPHPQGFVAILQAPIKGIIDSIDVILFILFIGGFMAVFTKTGALFEGVKFLAQRMKGKEKWLMVILIFIFSFFWRLVWDGCRVYCVLSCAGPAFYGGRLRCDGAAGHCFWRCWYRLHRQL